MGATATLGVVISVFDGAYALMAFPTMISALLLSRSVVRASRDYFRRLDESRKPFTRRRK
jgi:AGCS family alanine or glycine:cation symporter